jgi:hypothetical protein
LILRHGCIGNKNQSEAKARGENNPDTPHRVSFSVQDQKQASVTGSIRGLGPPFLTAAGDVRIADFSVCHRFVMSLSNSCLFGIDA